MKAILLAAALACAFAGAAAASGPGGPDSKWNGQAYVTGAEYAAQGPRWRHRKVARAPRLKHKHVARAGRHKHTHRARAARPGKVKAGRGNVRSRTGAAAFVAPAYASKFQCLIDKLGAAGYPIKFMGGVRRTYFGGYRSKHWCGKALDINQYARDVTRPRMPRAATQWAIDCGLTPGSIWGSPDTGHFEVPGPLRGACGYAGVPEPKVCYGLAAADAPLLVEPAPQQQFASLGPLRIVTPAPIRPSDREAIFQRDDDYNYLVGVYNRTPVKRDRSGDFTAKDPAAAALMKMSVGEYVIGGMSLKLRRALAKLGRELDAKGFRWSILSGYRDDVRQRMAAGFKALPGFSWHGGSRLTKGYGDGRAVDVTIADAGLDGPKEAGDIFAKLGRQYGLVRPMARRDPGHVQLAGLSSGRSRRHKWRRYAAH